MRTHQFIPDAQGDCVTCPLPAEHPTHVAPEQPEVETPVTPYAGTSGWSGSQTSRERVEHDDREGVTSDRQKRVLALLDAAGVVGMTWREIASAEVWHHGQSSGALSALHKEGHIARLAHERRERCAVYVSLHYVGDRETREQGRAAADPDVVRREEWRVMRNGSVVAISTDLDEVAGAVVEPGDVLQTHTVIETPWVPA